MAMLLRIQLFFDCPLKRSSSNSKKLWFQIGLGFVRLLFKWVYKKELKLNHLYISMKVSEYI